MNRFEWRPAAVFSVGAALLFPATHSWSQTVDPSALCAEQHMPGTDAYSRCLQLTPAVPPPPGTTTMSVGSDAVFTGRWRQGENRDRLDGAVAIFTQLPTRRTTIAPHRRPENRGEEAVLHVECQSKNLRMLVYVQGALIAGRTSKVSYRFDERPPATTRWRATVDYSGLGLWKTREAMAFLKQLAVSKALFVRVDHDVFGRFEADFATDGFAAAFRPIATACNVRL